MLALQLDGQISHGDSGAPAVVSSSNGFEIIGIAQVQSFVAGERASDEGLRTYEANRIYNGFTSAEDILLVRRVRELLGARE